MTFIYTRQTPCPILHQYYKYFHHISSSDIGVKLLVASGNEFHVAQAFFLPQSANCDKVLHPVNASLGKGRGGGGGGSFPDEGLSHTRKVHHITLFQEFVHIHGLDIFDFYHNQTHSKVHLLQSQLHLFQFFILFSMCSNSYNFTVN